MSSLYIYMNGLEVGEYSRQRGGTQEFIYYDSWLERKAAIPLSLSLPLTEKKHRGDKVYNYFDNLLPDNPNIRQRIQAKFGAKTNQPFDLLSHIGVDCIGAIQLLNQRSNVEIKKIEGLPVDEKQLAAMLRNYKTQPLGMSGNEGFRISLAGAQEKTALLWKKGQWHQPIGATPTTHIFKLPIGRIEHSNIDLSDSVDNEWLCLEILREFGLPVPSIQIDSFEEQRVLIVKRFDRKYSKDKSWIIRQPQEDMCQAQGIAPALKYESDGGLGITPIMELLMSAIEPEKDRKQFMKVVFIFWVLGAIDGHAKNFSIFLRQGGRFELTPFYDVISAYPLAASRQLELKKLKMAMALHSKNTHYVWYEIMRRHWFAESKKASFPKTEMEIIMHEIDADIDKVIDRVSARLPSNYPEEMATQVFDGMKHAMRRL